MTTAPELSIEVHRERVGVIYEYAELLARLERLPGTVAVRLDERDVERFRVGPAPSWLLALHLSEAASARWREGSGGFTETAPFFFSLRGDRLYAGVRYTTIGAAAINTPVLHEVQKDGRVVLFIGAQQGAAYMGSAREDFARRIDRPEIREVFRRRGVLEELPRPPSPMDPEYREK